MKSLLSFCCLLLSLTLVAQEDNWKKLRDQAEDAEKAGNYAQAAEQYERAFNVKTGKKELADKAAKNYYRLKNFVKSAELFSLVKDENKDFPLAGLFLARSLKQSGSYAAAKKEYVNFIAAYRGSDKDVLTKIVQNEVQGCELGMAGKTDKETAVTHLNEQINTRAEEVSPIPFSDDILYFTQSSEGKTQIQRSLRQAGIWSAPQTLENFPTAPFAHFQDGSFSPDLKRFYFTVCENQSILDPFASRCQLYVTRKGETAWNAPEKLRDYINTPSATHLNPHVVHDGNTEFIYYASNREGTKGGMDIWYIARDITSDDVDFTTPKNCGSTVNTLGDEMSPFYSLKDNALYFSSNGQVGIGGYDIFKAEGAKTQFTAVTNMGAPINSSRDDAYYVQSNNSFFGYFSSNRVNAPATPANYDLYVFGVALAADEDMVVSGSLSAANNSKIAGADLKLYELTDEGVKKLLATQSFTAQYSFPILPDKTYVIEADAPSFPTAVVEFSSSSKSLTKDIRFSTSEDAPAVANVPSATPNNATPTPETKPTPTPKPESKPATTTPSPTPNSVVTTTAPARTSPPTTPQPTPKPTTATQPNASAPSIEFEPTPAPSTQTVVETTWDTQPMPETTPTTTAPTTATPTQPKPTSAPSPTKATPARTAAKPVDATKPVVVTNTAPTTADNTWNTPATSAPTLSHTSVNTGEAIYKIQIAAVKTYLTNHPSYKCIIKKQLGELDTEYFSERDLTRVMVAGNYNVAQAESLLQRVRQCGFPNAFVTKYINGVRVPH